MIKIFMTLAALCFAVSASAGSGALDGKKFCRTVMSDGMFGQPSGERKHCLEFDGGIATDYANTFFGSPPSHAPYSVDGDKVTFDESEYSISGDQQSLTTIKGSTLEGIEFTLEK